MDDPTLAELLERNVRRAVPDEAISPEKADVAGDDRDRMVDSHTAAVAAALSRSAVADRAVSEYSF